MDIYYNLYPTIPLLFIYIVKIKLKFLKYSKIRVIVHLDATGTIIRKIDSSQEKLIMH